jgi:hypothetical protein
MIYYRHDHDSGYENDDYHRRHHGPCSCYGYEHHPCEHHLHHHP